MTKYIFINIKIILCLKYVHVYFFSFGLLKMKALREYVQYTLLEDARVELFTYYMLNLFIVRAED